MTKQIHQEIENAREGLARAVDRRTIRFYKNLIAKLEEEGK